MGDNTKIRLATGKRLARIRGSMNQADFAASIGVHKNTYGGYERGEVEAGAEALRQLVRHGWNPLWILTGYGEPHLPEGFSAEAVVDAAPESARGNADAEYRHAERGTSFPANTNVRDKAAKTDWDHSAQPVRHDLLKMALELTTEALGEKESPAAKHAELVTLVYELLEEGLPRAKVLRFVRAAAV